ncbi:MAG TPA: TolC family protein [Candidatus Acidoferrales bacterium]|nr:TolC family protein [Candidatus Acidoferrales bacterium]
MKALGTLSLILLAAPVWSQPPKKLSLREALDLANQKNLELAAARERRAVSLAGVRIARQLPNPSATFGASRDTPHENLLFDQPLEIGGRRHRRIELAQQSAGLTELEIESLTREVRQRVRGAFYAAAFAGGVSRQRGEALELAKRLREIAQARFQAGDVPQLEVFQAELEVSRAEAELRVAQEREKTAFSQLNVLLNHPPDTQWELVGSLEDLPPRQSLPELVERAAESNSGLRHLLQEQKVEQRRRALLQAERIPNVDVQFGTDFNAPRDFQVGPRGQISLVLPLFTRNQGEIAQSSANLRVLESETAATRRAVAGQVEVAYLELNSRQTQVELYRSALLPAARRLEGLAEDSYRAGKANVLTVLDAQRNVQQVQRDYLESLLALQTAFAGLEQTVGTPLD